jgi:glycosyltransferase involved in cell wall biosynthesis
MRAPGSERRLLIVGETLFGGLGGAVRHQADWFTDHGWRVDVATPLGEDPWPGPARHHPLSIPTSARDLAAMAKAIRRLRAVIRSSGPTVIHCHGLRSFSIARLASPIPPYVTLHGTGTAVDDPIGYDMVRRLGLWIAPYLAEDAYNTGPEQRRGWTFALHASPRLVALDRLPFPEQGSEPVFLWLGRLSEPKLPGLFVEAVCAAAKVRPLHGVLAGDGPLSDEVERMIARLDAPIEIVGHSDDVAGLLGRSWALVLLSRFEGLAFSVEEAMWAGRAVIGSPLPSNRWLLDDVGLVAGDLDSVTSSILKLTDWDTAVRLGSESAIRIRNLVAPWAPWPTLEAAYLRHLNGSG